MTDRNVISTETIKKKKVRNHEKEDLGNIEEIMIDEATGKVAYVVLSFGGFLGLGDKLFALPWQSLKFDHTENCYVLNWSKEQLKDAPGFEKDHWPNFSEPAFGSKVYDYYRVTPFWQ